MDAYKYIDVRPLAGAVGAEISGIDLAQPVSASAVAEIRQAWLAHGVVFFRGQTLAPAAFQNFAERFGEVIEYPFVKGIEGFPLIIPVLKLAHERNNFGGIWHTDTAYLETPPMATMLIAREVPPFGGDTLFASGYAAFEALSPTMQHLLESLRGMNTSAKADVTKTREDRIKEAGTEQAKREFVAEHPVVRTHPETGRKALYVNFGHTARFAGMTDEESKPLLDFLFAHQVRPEFTCRFSWGVGSLAFWDNRCVLHNPVNDYHGYKRLLHRVTLKGDTPR
ncbi:MAG: TauD/TfdA family dioxygenase [Gammaproteobacteria bacterium]|nr:TauD/TfdA family dioxygenase [Gammaproteobacteria bacterium]